MAINLVQEMELYQHRTIKLGMHCVELEKEMVTLKATIKELETEIKQMLYGNHEDSTDGA